MQRKVALDAAFAAIDRPWRPHVVGEVGDHLVKVAKLDGEFVWHAHEHEDELFLVHRGRLRLLFRDGEVELGPGELVVVPAGVEHLPIADEPCEVVFFEPGTTLNTGDAEDPRRIEDLPRL
jgi:mannose-6-phosphate isomerase-like protein (cupin superfamily)